MKNQIKEILIKLKSNMITNAEAEELYKKLQHAESDHEKILVRGPCSIEDTEIVSVVERPLKPNEVKIHISAFSLNFGDLLLIKGLYPSMPSYPFTPGFEACGIVVEVGDAVTQYQINNEVIILADKDYGLHASSVIVAESCLRLKPDFLTDEMACALPITTLTAIEVLHRAQLKKDESILIQTATGSLGLTMVQLAKEIGSHIIATASTKEKLEYLRNLGVTDVINYKTQNFEEEVKRLTEGRGVDVVLNTLGGDNIEKGIRCLAKRGRYIEVAVTALKASKKIDISSLVENQSFISLDLRKLGLEDKKYFDKLWEDFINLVKKEIVKPVISKVFHFDQIKEAYHYLENRNNIGKVVITIPSKKSDNAIHSNKTDNIQHDIAIIGISGKFGNTNSVEAYWECLAQGVSLIEEIPKERWDKDLYYKNTIDCQWGSFIKDIGAFDPLFFGIAGVEARAMDPQQRHFLECCWTAIEDAGLRYDTLNNSKTAVIVGSAISDYSQLMNDNSSAQAFWGNSSSILASRISYLLNLKSQAIAVDTACSSSLVAIHLACQGLRIGDYDVALAGGVFIQTTPKMYILASKAKMLSPDGQCYAFDERANGFVPGEAVGVLVLKRLDNAIKDKNTIYAVIKATGTNQDGTTNGITAPNMLAQASLQKEIYQRNHINPRTIQYIETHGTGTKLGDPIEIKALTQSFSQYTADKAFCAIGSVKTNIGHSITAAGVAGVIKVVLALKHKKIPPSLNFQTGNSTIDFQNSPFYVNTELREWAQNGNNPRRAAVSSFGFSGTNAHIIIDEYISKSSEVFDNNTTLPVPIFPVSATNKEALKRYIEMVIDYLHQPVILNRLLYTFQISRKPLETRLAIIVKNKDDLVRKLSQYLTDEVIAEECYFKENGTIELTENALSQWISNKNWDNVARNWAHGAKINWHNIYEEQPQFINAPTYPFAKEKYWFNDENLMRKSCFLEKKWVETINPEMNKVATRQSIGLILTTPNLTILNEKLNRRFPNFKLITQPVDNINDIAFELIDSCIDITSFDENIYPNDFYWITILQKIITLSKQPQIKLIQFTHGLENINNQSSKNLFGAERVGLYRMLQSEYAKVKSRHVDIEYLQSIEDLIHYIEMEWFNESSEIEVSYYHQKRFTPIITERDVKSLPPTSFDSQGVIWITGGTSGIGMLCAKHLVQKHQIKKLVLMGTHTIPDRPLWMNIINSSDDNRLVAILRNLIELEESGAKVLVSADDITDPVAMKNLLGKVKITLGPIVGVIHSAGIFIEKNPAFISKKIEDINNVGKLKITALNILHETFKNENLRFFYLFSSVSTLIPVLAVGHSDYCMANTFMNYFAAFQQVKGFDYYKSIQWPSWLETGFGQVTSKTYEQTGLLCHTNEEGLKFLDTILSSTLKNTIVTPAIVNPTIFNSKNLNETALPNSNKKVNVDYPFNEMVLKITKELTLLFAEVLQLPVEQINAKTHFNKLGVDSILLAQFVTRLEEYLDGKKINPNVLLEHPSIAKLTEYLISHHLAAFSKDLFKNNSLESLSLKQCKQNTSDKIAIIGLACHFPKAKCAKDYWKILQEGQDCMVEIPQSRWSIDAYHVPNQYVPGKSISKWGAFLDNIEDFDPDYFGIASDDAPFIDPLTRQWLEVSCEAFQDAHYDKTKLWDKSVGIFVGARVSHFATKFSHFNKNSLIGTGQNFITAHLAQVFNLKGPSMVVDTACSSSLTAIHLACESIKSGESEMAIAGGTDILLDENTYIMLSKANILASDGRCKPFAANADGIGLGEGCGAIVLKSLDKALEDNDKIYAVIDGSSINSDGKTLGITTPNPEAQQELITKTINKAKIDPRTITYIEAHGTGTLIGDPIELQAIASLFNNLTTDKQYCAVGSVKSNIGHLLSASGVASIIKVILSITHKKLVPTLHCQILNPRFNIEKSALYISRDLHTWQGYQNVHRAGVSAFGLGGHNSHIIISDEEIPQHLKIETINNSVITFNKKRYWPTNDKSDSSTSLNSFLTIEKM